MSSRPLIIRLEQMKEIYAAIDRARTRPLPRDAFDRLVGTVPQDTSTIKLADRKGYDRRVRDRYPPQQGGPVAGARVRHQSESERHLDGRIRARQARNQFCLARRVDDEANQTRAV
jgi:hypothetical protein